ncbi:hypothetical protein [Gordonia sp. NPDC003422]
MTSRVELEHAEDMQATARTETRPPRTPTRRRPWQCWMLAVIELLIAAQATYGGLSLIADTWQMNRDWLERTPFDSWVGPGWMLIALIAVPHLAAAIAALVPSSPRLGVLGGVLAGATLLLWIVVQIATLQVFFFLQPVIAVVGVLEIGLALWWRSDHPEMCPRFPPWPGPSLTYRQRRPRRGRNSVTDFRPNASGGTHSAEPPGYRHRCCSTAETPGCT